MFGLSRTSRGSAPQWSRCAWVMTAASIPFSPPKSGVAGPRPSGLIPASTRIFDFPKSSRWLLPPTSPAPPSARKESVGRGLA